MKALAATYYSHFLFGSSEGQLRLALSSKAPAHLRELVRRVCGPSPSQECLSRLYECLCSLADNEARVSPQQPSEELFLAVDQHLRQRLDA